jgi:fucose 4-O-acetylase-like acetyltransferase
MIQLYEVDFPAGMMISILPERRFPHAGQVRETTPEYSLKYYDVSHDIAQYTSRYISGICGIALLCVLVYCMKLADSAERIRSILRFLGKYSLELYLLHVTMRNLMETLELQSYRMSRYAMIMAVSILLAPVLHKLTVWTQEHVLTGRQQSE